MKNNRIRVPETGLTKLKLLFPDESPPSSNDVHRARAKSIFSGLFIFISILSLLLRSFVYIYFFIDVIVRGVYEVI